MQRLVDACLSAFEEGREDEAFETAFSILDRISPKEELFSYLTSECFLRRRHVLKVNAYLRRGAQPFSDAAETLVRQYAESSFHCGFYEEAAKAFGHLAEKGTAEDLRNVALTLFRMGKIAEASVAAEFFQHWSTGPVRTLFLTNAAFGEIPIRYDLMAKLIILGEIPKIRYVAPVSIKERVNEFYFNCYREYFDIVRDPAECDRLRVTRPLYLTDFFPWRGRLAIRDFVAQEVWLEWSRRGLPQLVNFEGERLEEAKAGLRRLGVPDGAWFVVLHVRTNGYQTRPGFEEGCRNADITTYRAAVERIAERGGWVVRTGDLSMPPIEGWPNTVDYVHSPFCSEMMDVYLLWACRFGLMSASGPLYVAKSFGRPVVATNIIPRLQHSFLPEDILIHKNLRRVGTEEYLDLRQVFAPALVERFQFAAFRELNGLEFVDNDAEEIEAATVEMMDRLDGTGLAPEDLRIAERYRQVIAEGKTSYLSLVSPFFARRWAHLADAKAGATAAPALA